MFRFFTRFPFPIRAGGAPYASAALRQFTKNRKSAVSHPASPYAVAMPHRSPCASDPHTGNIPIPPQSDHVPAETSAAGLRKPGANRSPQTPCGCDGVQPADGVNAWRRFATRRRSGAPRSSRHLWPREWIPEESGQAGLDKSPQTRRRIAQDGWQITQARPGVTLAPGFAVSTSLLYHVFLEASR